MMREHATLNAETRDLRDPFRHSRDRIQNKPGVSVHAHHDVSVQPSIVGKQMFRIVTMQSNAAQTFFCVF